MLVVSVLKQGKNYCDRHAKWLHNQLKAYDSICLTDIDKIKNVQTTPLQYNFPGWWSKLELFNPKHPILGNKEFLFLDIDTVIVNNIDHFIKTDRFTMLNDFFQTTPNRKYVNSSVMKVTNDVKKYIWNTFMNNPKKYMKECVTKEKWGDQGFISSLFDDIQQWQDIFPDQIYSYKNHIVLEGMPGFDKQLSKGIGNVPETAKIICFHGNPRPWKIQQNWIPRFSLYDRIISKYHKMTWKDRNQK